ncbi:MAG TPA: hypothetical protein VMS11_04785 [Solirubrobacterales bacterium]|nr:hypothetical protein [Solirubrobacterales bacterium]
MRSASPAIEAPVQIIDATHRFASTEELMRRMSEGDQEALAELVRRGGEAPEVEVAA